MLTEFISVFQVAGQTLLKIIPISIAMGNPLRRLLLVALFRQFYATPLAFGRSVPFACVAMADPNDLTDAIVNAASGPASGETPAGKFVAQDLGKE